MFFDATLENVKQTNQMGLQWAFKDMLGTLTLVLPKVILNYVLWEHGQNNSQATLCISSRDTGKERRDTIANLASRNRNEKIQITVLFRQDILSRLGQKGGKKSSFWNTFTIKESIFYSRSAMGILIIKKIS